jgi:hypothetical protein
MSGTKIIASIGLTLAVVVLLAVGAAMYLVDKDAIAIDLDLDYCRMLGGTNTSDKNLQKVSLQNQMELRGHWNGMGLAPASSRGAAEAGAIGVTEGVVIVHIDPDRGNRVAQAGLQVGDVIVGIDGQSAKNLAEVHAITQKTRPMEPTLVAIQRAGQSMTLVIPADPMPANMGMQVAAGPQFVCPRDGTLVPAAQATAGVCPLCGGPLQPMAAPGAFR